MKRYICCACGYVYDPDYGESEMDVAPGTQFEQIDESWRCPECGVLKKAFLPEGEEQLLY